MRTRPTALLAALAILATGGFIAGCGGDDDDGGGAGERQLVNEGELLVGVDTPYPPFEIGQPPDITGYDIEVMNAIADRLELEVTYQDTNFDTIPRDIAQGKFDAVTAAMTILPEREEKVDFTDPYFAADQSLLVTPGSDIRTVDDLAGKTVGAQDATTGEDYANDETGAAEVRPFPEGPDVVQALKAGQVDAAIIDLPVAQDAVEKEGGVEVATVIPTGEFYGFPTAEDNDALREDMNEALQEMKDDGTLNELYMKYFNTEAPESVLTRTNEPLQGTKRDIAEAEGRPRAPLFVRSPGLVPSRRVN
jgi:polar amino acid transport system substrate-binding protein